MKKLIQRFNCSANKLILIIALASSAYGQKITDLPAIGTIDPTVDVLPIVDLTGPTSSKVTVNSLFTGYGITSDGSDLVKAANYAAMRALLDAVPTTRTITGNSPLNGGGDLSANRTIGLANFGVQNTHLAAITGPLLKGRDDASLGSVEDLAPADVRVMLGLVVGTDVQAFDSDLNTWAGITPSTNIQTFLGSADYTAARNNLSLGTANTPVFTGLATPLKIGVSATENVLLGSNGSPSSTGQKNITLGFDAGNDLLTGNENTLIGRGAGRVITGVGNGDLSGGLNTALGSDALGNGTTALANTIIGQKAGTSLTTGSYNTILGKSAGAGLITNQGGIWIGHSAGEFATSSSTALGQVFIGEYAGSYAAGTTGHNVCIGFNSGAATVSNLFTGENNVFIGSYTGEDSRTLVQSVAVGSQAGRNLTTGGANTLIGYKAGEILTTHINNIAIGSGSGTLLAGEANILIGNDINVSLTGRGNLLIGKAAGTGLPAATNSTAVIGGPDSNESINDIYFGKGYSSSAPFTYRFRGTRGSGTDIAGGGIGLNGGLATGNAAGGSIRFTTSDAGASSSTIQSETEKGRITALGNLLLGTTSETGLTGGGGIKLNSATDTTTLGTGSFVTAGGASVAKALRVGTTLTVDGATTLTGGVAGVITVSDATAGNLGEYFSASVIQGSALALTTATPKTVASISLTAGDWQITGVGAITGASTGTVFDVAIGTTTDSFTGTILGDTRCQTPTVSLTGADASLMIPDFRVNVSSTTTYYLIVSETFTVGTPAAYGRISARRVR